MASECTVLHDAHMSPVELNEHEAEVASYCISLAESVLANLTPDVSSRLDSSREASGVVMAIVHRERSGEIPYATSRIASCLVGHATDKRWPDWRDGIPIMPPPMVCSACATELPISFQRSWQWCPVCGAALD
jgi:hypothetical protein